ncbi:hypothetical protein E1301_Tti013490 [Triplophysa tibetana]|uniref:PARP catalytic domain-containing protein n=1 Tax=Triplophysa tibetana TaxID=1572043 RepID=A0A5A9NQZ8_9TELE|nr:hypothetical protein E1301_Tti013490 [Triplophysa tibetana]
MAAETVRKAEALTAFLKVPVKLQSEVLDFNRAVKLEVKDLMKMVLLGKKEKTSSFLKEVYYVIPEEFFDPVYDLDFAQMCTNLSGNRSESDPASKRGNETYVRPYGWKRYGLMIRDKYPDGNAWLGTHGLRNDSEPFEWPVSYHGTSLEAAKGIFGTHYKVGANNEHGRGIYSTPKIEVAEDYAKTVERKFKSKTNGKIYSVAIQNRINPKKRVITTNEDYWLVPIPEGTSDEGEREIVESSIRPYGLLLKEVQEGN